MIRSLFRSDRRVVSLVSAFFIAVVLADLFARFYVDKLWFEAAGYSAVFWKQLIWQWGARVFTGILAALFIYANLKIASKSLGKFRIRRQMGDLVFSEEVSTGYVNRIGLIVAAFFGLWFGLVVSSRLGLQFLFTLNGASWGEKDPIFERDLSFYVVSLPFFETLVGLVAGIVAVSLLIVIIIYVLSGVIGISNKLQWTPSNLGTKGRPRKHLAVLVCSLLTILAGMIWLSRYGLLTNGNSAVQNIFGYTDYYARLPVLNLLTGLTLSLAISTLAVGFKRLAIRVPMVIFAFTVFGLGAGQIYPSFVQRFRVEPNELSLEGSFIEENMRFTRMGFGLSELERKEFEYKRPEEGVDWLEAMEQFNGLPVWNAQALLTTYRELEARFPYYDFFGATIDRYPTDEGVVPVALSVREILPSGIQDRNWQNVHIRTEYIQGNGIVASYASNRTSEGRPPMLISGIPPDVTSNAETPSKLLVDNPTVFVGSNPQNYAVVNEKFSEDRKTIRSQFNSRGIPINSLTRTIASAWYFQDTNLLFSDDLDTASELLFKRDALDRVRSIAGSILHFPEQPYPVVHEGAIVWVLDGFTMSSDYPLSKLTEFPGTRGMRYVRNSVKVTVDAETGEVVFYVVDANDPLLDLYRNSFPGMFLELASMPSELQAHLRYSTSMLDLQANVLNQYHQETASLFHGQQDVWTLPQELSQNSSTVPYRSEYGIYTLPGESEEAFLLTTAFVPRGRQNLTAILVAHNDPQDYGRLVLFEIPVEDQVPGPRQVEALIEQDPVISQQFSLWRTGGSQVWTGHIHLVPVGETLVYMEPVFLAAEEDAIPELRRFVVSDGYRVSMEPTLAGAIGGLETDIFEMTAESLSDIEDIEELREVTRDWPAEALNLLEQAERAAQNLDFAAFGESLRQLRDLLQNLSVEGGL